MERGFIGLAVKQECTEEAIDAAPLRSTKMQWPVSNKACAVPQLFSFQSAQTEKPKTGFDSLASTGLVTITTTETFDSGAIQRNNFGENQGGVRYTVTSYPANHLEAHAIRRPVTTQTNLPVSLTGAPAIHQPFIAPSGQNLVSPINPQLISAVPLPSSSPVVGTTHLRNTPKISGAPAQLTIFYNGSVCVYDNVSADKAQAIMLLAGNGPPATSNATTPNPTAPVQASMPKPSILESFVVNHPYGNTTPHKSAPTAIASSSTVPHSLGWSGTINNAAAPKQRSILVSSHKVQPQKVVSSPRSVSPTFVPPSTVPQFRRKSLARFLEKRQGRAVNTLPYANSESPDCNSSGSYPVQTVK